MSRDLELEISYKVSNGKIVKRIVNVEWITRYRNRWLSGHKWAFSHCQWVVGIDLLIKCRKDCAQGPEAPFASGLSTVYGWHMGDKSQRFALSGLSDSTFSMLMSTCDLNMADWKIYGVYQCSVLSREHVQMDRLMGADWHKLNQQMHQGSLLLSTQQQAACYDPYDFSLLSWLPIAIRWMLMIQPWLMNSPEFCSDWGYILCWLMGWLIAQPCWLMSRSLAYTVVLCLADIPAYVALT